MSDSGNGWHCRHCDYHAWGRACAQCGSARPTLLGAGCLMPSVYQDTRPVPWLSHDERMELLGMGSQQPWHRRPWVRARVAVTVLLAVFGWLVFNLIKEALPHG